MNTAPETIAAFTGWLASQGFASERPGVFGYWPDDDCQIVVVIATDDSLVGWTIKGPDGESIGAIECIRSSKKDWLTIAQANIARILRGFRL